MLLHSKLLWSASRICCVLRQPCCGSGLPAWRGAPPSPCPPSRSRGSVRACRCNNRAWVTGVDRAVAVRPGLELDAAAAILQFELAEAADTLESFATSKLRTAEGYRTQFRPLFRQAIARNKKEDQPSWKEAVRSLCIHTLLVLSPASPVSRCSLSVSLPFSLLAAVA